MIYLRSPYGQAISIFWVYFASLSTGLGQDFLKDKLGVYREVIGETFTVKIDSGFRFLLRNGDLKVAATGWREDRNISDIWRNIETEERHHQQEVFDLIGRSLKVAYCRPMKFDYRNAHLFLVATAVTFKNNCTVAEFLTKQLKDTLIDEMSPLGDGVVDFGICFLMRAFGDQRAKETADLGIAALVNAGLAAQLLKRLSGVPRPCQTTGDPKFTGPSWRYDSFPSGHSAVAFAFATILEDKYPERKGIFYALATFVALSRVTHGAHWPADVLAGAGLGMLFGHHTLKYQEEILK